MTQNLSSGPVKVLLLWPGTTGAAAGNFGVPQLVLMATYARMMTGAEVHIRDLVCEAALGPVEMDKILDGDDRQGYDIIGFSVYSSFDHLKSHAIAELARKRWPNALIACGGYHASARPDHFVYDGSPFDVCVVGEGEKPLVQMIESVSGGEPMRNVVMGPHSVDKLGELPSSDWTYLDRYKGIARKVASQAQVYLSRGCPFDCAFCMERAKRDVSWRPVPVEQAVHEITSLHDYLNLEGWTLYIADALFGMKKSWRREFLAALAEKQVPVDKLWLLIRVDLVEDEDLRLFDAANCGLGFGLESGDKKLLAAIRKAGRLDTYLERMMHVADWARQRNVPWGANIICGHPGETPETMRVSAEYMKELFLQPKGTTGFLSIDPFRLYPGSPIDAQRPHYEHTYGTKFYRPEWWNDGDPEFLSEWIDPSSELTWLERERLQAELLTPVVTQIEEKFVYQGKSRDYFLRAIRDQVQLFSPEQRGHYLDRYFAWSKYLGLSARGESELRSHVAFAGFLRQARQEVLPKVAALAGLGMESPIMQALEKVPRELFVPLDQTKASTQDVPLPLDNTGDATISAMHAYALTFSLLDIKPGDHVLDLGAGSGYGSALLSELVGDSGSVTAVELDPLLGRSFQEHLPANVRWIAADATDSVTWEADAGKCSKVAVGFALEGIPLGWAQSLPEGAVVVAPIGESKQQNLVRATLSNGEFRQESFVRVRYVRTRHSEDLPAPVPERKTKQANKRLPVMS